MGEWNDGLMGKRNSPSHHLYALAFTLFLIYSFTLYLSTQTYKAPSGKIP
ncbi:hypothetical protein J7K55_02340 [Candidatus Aerophobetes bacterium]|nr:hypothetical protein [Candidatus Aerophobetes bacterium]